MIRLYTRVSTEEQGDSGLGLDAQDRALLARYADEETTSYCDVGTAKEDTLDREGLSRLMAEIRPGDTLAVAKLDRLTRSIMDFGQLLEAAAKGGWYISALDLGVDTSTPTGELVANIMVAIAQWERKMIGLRTREALAEKKANGQTLGRSPDVDPQTIDQIRALAGKFGPTAIARKLTEDKIPAPRGGTAWYPSTVRGILARLEDTS